MNKITATCASALDPIDEYVCGGLKGNRVHSLVIGRSDATLVIAASGVCPTVADFQVGMTATEVVVLTHISNGLIDEVGSSELTDLDTESGLPEKFNIQMGITGNIKHPTSDVYARTMEYNLNPLLKVWVIDNKGYIWGGETGYLTNGLNAFSPKKMDGTTQMISFNLVYIADDVLDDSLYDADALTLDNAAAA